MPFQSMLDWDVRFRPSSKANLKQVRNKMDTARFMLVVTYGDMWDDDTTHYQIYSFPVKPTKRQIRKAVKQFKRECSL